VWRREVEKDSFVFPQIDLTFLNKKNSIKYLNDFNETSNLETEKLTRKIPKCLRYFFGLIQTYKRVYDTENDIQRRLQLSNSYPWENHDLENNNNALYSNDNKTDSFTITSQLKNDFVSKPKPGKAYSKYNLYYLTTLNLPCVYYDYQENQYEMKILMKPICCSSYHYPIEVNANTLRPLTISLMKNCNDERTQDFTLALMDFVDWDMMTNRFPSHNQMLSNSYHSTESLEVDKNGYTIHGEYIEPYEWPRFILDLINDNKIWASWRKQKERVYLSSKRKAYFEGLIDDYKASQRMSNALIESQSSLESDVPKKTSKSTKSSQREKVKPKKVNPLQDDNDDNRYNMFWLPTLNLPSLYFDSNPSRDPHADIIQVLPICCSTYHYPTKIEKYKLKPFHISQLKNSTDDRTNDFIMALIQFAEWDLANNLPKIQSTSSSLQSQQDTTTSSVDSTTVKNKSNGSAVSNEDILIPYSPSLSSHNKKAVKVSMPAYEWPSFILDLVSNPKKWASWRKNAERKVFHTNISNRIQAYYVTLVDDFHAQYGCM
jgi:hypothetical protein